MRIIRKLLNEYVFFTIWTIFIIGNNPVTINKGNDWFFANIFLLSWISCAGLLLKYLLAEVDTNGKIKNLLFVFCCNVLSIIVFFFMAFLFSGSEKYYAAYQKKFHISGSLYLVDVFQMLLIIVVIISLYYLGYFIITGKFKGLEVSNLKKIFFTAATISIFLIIVFFLMFGFSPEFAGNLFW